MNMRPDIGARSTDRRARGGRTSVWAFLLMGESGSARPGSAGSCKLSAAVTTGGDPDAPNHTMATRGLPHYRREAILRWLEEMESQPSR